MTTKAPPAANMYISNISFCFKIVTGLAAPAAGAARIPNMYISNIFCLTIVNGPGGPGGRSPQYHMYLKYILLVCRCHVRGVCIRTTPVGPQYNGGNGGFFFVRRFVFGGFSFSTKVSQFQK
jgi:hypothetical protein